MKQQRVVHVSDGYLYVKRWDNLVHIIERCPELVFTVTRSGRPTSGSFPVAAFCGQKAKMHLEGANRFVEEPPTCLECIHHQQLEGRIQQLIRLRGI